MPALEFVDRLSKMGTFVSAEWLWQELRSLNSEVLIIDCKTPQEFRDCHIRNAVNLTLPSLMLRRLANGKLNLASVIKCLCHDARDRFSRTYKKHTVVLYDEHGDMSDPTSPLNILYKKFRQDGCQVWCLEGGLHEFQPKFPEWCELESGEDTILGLSNLRISCGQSSSSGTETSDAQDADEDKCDSSLGHDTPTDDGGFPVEILPYLFLGNAKNSMDQEALNCHNIRYILNVTPNLPNVFEDKGYIKYMQIPISDHWSQNLARYFPSAISFIEEARQNQQCVLVHCLAGISRSVTITVAYLMYKLSMSLNEAYDFVKVRKSNIAPNFNFMGQLLDFERQLNQSPTPCTCDDKDTPCKCGAALHFLSPSHTSPDSGIEFDRWT